ncbi:hypothetical protein KSP39_PZI008021 [Platanthera zijinensis]|uniref:Uncharacterized protein n=1 Tax=Platanthera zijinensis TaxID=2320716 RepID=A0AAP0G9B6_9ASPA
MIEKPVQEFTPGLSPSLLTSHSKSPSSNPHLFPSNFSKVAANHKNCNTIQVAVLVPEQPHFGKSLSILAPKVSPYRFSFQPPSTLRDLASLACFRFTTNR